MPFEHLPDPAQLPQVNSDPAADMLIAQDVAVVRARFDCTFYLAKYPHLAGTVTDPVEHYCRNGWRDLYDPSPDFSTQFYLRSNRDVARAGVNPFAHFILQGAAEGRLGRIASARGEDAQARSSRLADEQEVIRPYFDAEFYLQRYPDVAEAGIDPLAHYCLHGWKESRDPCNTFSTAYYIHANPDIRAAGVNAFWHYLVAGKGEGRQARPEDEDWQPSAPDSGSTEARFARESALVRRHLDPEFYRLHYPEAAQSDLDPVTHYLRIGAAAGHDPSADFSTRYYIDTNPDIAGSGVNPFWHYLTVGRQEGRDPRHPGGQEVVQLGEMGTLADEVRQWRRKARPRRLLTPAELVPAILGGARDAELILALSHDAYHKVSGGVQLCIQHEAGLAARTGAIYLNLHPWQPLPRLAHEAEEPDPLMVLLRNGKAIGTARVSDLIVAVETMRPQIRRARVVIHHLLGHLPETIPALTRAAGQSECWLWLHDFFTICPNYTLLRNKLRYCGAPDASSNACTLCRFGSERRSHAARIATLFRAVKIHVLAPSEVTADLWQDRAGLRAESLSIVPHMSLRWHRRKPVKRCSEGPITIGFLGTPAPHKGWNVFARLVHSHAADGRFRFVYLGVQPMQLAGVEHIPVHVTADTPNAMIDAVRGTAVDLVLHWASWPETFSLSTYEALAGGAYVLTNPVSGNVAATVMRIGRGAVLDDEAALEHFMAGGKVSRLVAKLRTERAAKEVRHEMSRMSFEVWDEKRQGEA